MSNNGKKPKPMFPLPLSREAIAPYVGECFHAGRSLTQADLFHLHGVAEGWILKDFGGRPLWMRLLATRRVACREGKALQALQALGGVPRWGGFLGPDAFIMERLSAVRLPHRNESGQLEPVFFSRLDALVGRMHALGWAHGDLRRKNILVDAAQNPYLIDFATAIYGGRGAGLISRLLFRHVAKIDRITVAKLKKSYLPHSLDEAEHAILAQQPWLLRLGRWWKKKIYRPLKPRHRKETWEAIRRKLGGE